MNNNTKTGIREMDIITLYSVYKQLENMSLDSQQTAYIQNVIKAIDTEISKLHKENDIIIQQNNEILTLLKERGL